MPEVQKIKGSRKSIPLQLVLFVAMGTAKLRLSLFRKQYNFSVINIFLTRDV